jgi:ketosteroid isomerase-like protein
LGPDPSTVIDRLVQTTNDHDLDALVACFHPTYVNETPAHPQRGFKGRDQVRKNWVQILSAVTDIRAQVLQSVTKDDSVWTEWEMAGTREDGSEFLMRGMIIFRVEGEHVMAARFYLEPVELSSGDVNVAVSRAIGHSDIAVDEE